MDIKAYMQQVGRQARAASRLMAKADTQTKNQALNAIADALLRDADTLLAANKRDMDQAHELEPAMLDRLLITSQTIESMADGLRQIASLPDPVGEICLLYTSLGQIDELIEEWLTMSTLDKPQLNLETQPIEILPWLRRQISEFSSQSSITPELINLLPGQTPYLEADSHYLTRALANLMSNSRRYGGTQIALTVQWENGRAQIHIDDNGQGIPESERQRLLQPFERLEVSRNRQTGGFGLGLAIVSMIMRGHGGSAAISDAPLGGARVTLSWPTPLKDAGRSVL